MREYSAALILASLLGLLAFLAIMASRPSEEAVEWAVRDAHMTIYLARERGSWSTGMSPRTCQLAEHRLEEMDYVVRYDTGSCTVSWDHWGEE